MKNKSRDLVYLDGDVEVRNYYGWVFPRHSPKTPKGTVEVSAYPLRYANEGRPKIDLDGSALHQLLTDRQSLISEWMHFLNVHLPEGDELQAIQNVSIVMENCVVEVFIRDQGNTIRSSVNYLQSLMQDPLAWPLTDGLRVTDWWCARNEGISCPFGAVVFYNTTIPWTDNYDWQLLHTIIKFVPRKDAEVAVSDAFLLAVEDMTDYVAIPYNLELNFRVCKQKAIIQNMTIYDPLRSIPPSTVINFQERLYGCVAAFGAPVIKVTDLILRNIFSFDEWPVVFPFVDAEARSTIILENVIVEMDTTRVVNQTDLEEMVDGLRKRKRPQGLGTGEQNLTVWKPEDCQAHLNSFKQCKTQGKCPKEAKCPSGAIFIEDASYMIEEDDGNGDLGIGVRYRIRHSLITVIPPHSADGSDPHAVTEFRTDENMELEVNQKSETKHALLVSAFVIIGIMCGLLVLCGYVSYKYGLFDHFQKAGEAHTSHSMRYAEKLGSAVRTFLTPEMPSGALAAARYLDTHQSYQQMANHLLGPGSVNLGPQLGAGSFGKVFKATWNGATVAVKVIVHDGLSFRGAAAQREALLSSNLHHPNIVQTFVQTTREIKHDEHVPVASQSQPSQAAQTVSVMPPQPVQENQQMECANDGYVNLAQIVPNEYKPERPQRSLSSCSDMSSVGKSFSGDRVETWLIQEFCDMGSLEKSIRKGRYMKGHQLNMSLVVETCVDICRGMQYLKNRNVIHGDLKSSNILLNGSMHEEKGFIAKVADFGLSRELGMFASHVSTQTTGTVTHMPPELFKEERLTAASDVYSFGIVMWELVSKESPLEGVPPVLIIKKIIYDNWRPTFMEGIPDCYTALARRCWAEDSLQRPVIDEVLSELEQMRQQFMQPPQ